MESPHVSKRLSDLPVSAVRKLAPLAKEAKKEGVKIYHLNIGDPDIKTPDVMINSLHNFANNPISYADSRGEHSFIKALQWYYTQNGGSFLTEADMVVTVGGSEAVVMAMFATCQPGDEILVFEPFYSNYATCAGFAGVKLVAVASEIESGFHLPSQKTIEAKITPKTKAILFCSPGNPTGTVYTKSEFEMLVKIATKHNLFLLSDEVYREFTYEGQEHISLLSYMEEIPDHAILLDSLSKRYSLCGARLGVLASLNKTIVHGALKLAQGRLSAGLIEQVMAAQLTEVPLSYMQDVITEYKKRRNVLYKGLMEIPGVFLAKPEGAFYTMVSLPVENAEEFCIFLLEKFRINNETVMLAPGEGFYQTPGKGINQVRMAYVLNVDDLKKSIEILKAGLVQYTT